MYFATCGVLVLLGIIQAANGLTCYSCNTKDSVSCTWGITSFIYPTEECPRGLLDHFIGPKCYKITAESKDGREYVARGCLPSEALACNAIASAIGWISSQSSNDGDSVRSINCDTCNTDRCNSAQKVMGVTLVGLVLAAAVFVI